MPLALGMYELLPLWYTLFTELGFEVVVSDMSTRHTYERGQFSIPSDTACYPAKLMHGHVVELIDKGVDAIFYPCVSYNVDEKVSDNHFNCPIVAYYSELLHGNMDELRQMRFLYPYLNLSPNSAGSQFFIMHANAPHLDGQYAAFGKVSDDESMKVVDRIATTRTGFQDRPVAEQRIKSITVDTKGEEYKAEKM